jgi:uncharacterized protein YkwD
LAGVAALVGAACLGGFSEGGEKTGKVPDDVKAVLDLTNAERAKEGLSPLKLNPKLNKAAQEHSDNMAKQGVLEHKLDGLTPGDRIRKLGYRPGPWGENIALANSPKVAMEMWMKSKGHRENILKTQFTEMGVGIARDERGRQYYTQVFSKPGK